MIRHYLLPKAIFNTAFHSILMTIFLTGNKESIAIVQGWKFIFFSVKTEEEEHHSTKCITVRVWKNNEGF